MIIFDRLKRIETHVREIEKELSDPSVIRDQTKFQKLTKELASLRPIVQLFDEYRAVEKELSALQGDGPWFIVAKVQEEAEYMPVAPIEPEMTTYRLRNSFRK